jgi:hypothetical protein
MGRSFEFRAARMTLIGGTASALPENQMSITRVIWSSI